MATNEDNLISFGERTEDEQREIARKGGVASGKARRRKRTMAEALQLITNTPVNAEQAEILRKYGFAERDCTYLMLMMMKAVQMASEGNLKAAEFVRDTLGESPQYKINEKRLQVLIADKEASRAVIDEWVSAIPDITADE